MVYLAPMTPHSYTCDPPPGVPRTDSANAPQRVTADDPRRAAAGESPLVLDSPAPKIDVSKLMAAETRFQLTAQQDPERYRELQARARAQIQRRLALYQELATKPGALA